MKSNAAYDHIIMGEKCTTLKTNKMKFLILCKIFSLSFINRQMMLQSFHLIQRKIQRLSSYT